MEASEALEIVARMHADARDRGVFFQTISDAELNGRSIELNGQTLVNFGSCSYLGLEFHPDMIEGATDAARRFGTQFSCSRGYLSIPLYEEVEAQFAKIFGGPVMIAPTTTLGHLAAFDALLTEKDALVMDHQVHQSVQQAARLVQARGTTVRIVKHEDIERAVGIVHELRHQHRTVWFATDGVASMYGDYAPFALLRQLMDVAPNVRLYVDDAHGMSWAGQYGRGSFLKHIPLGPQVVVATSLAKGFGAGGAVLVFPSVAERDQVRMCGGTLLFGGPIQPPMLGAIRAGAKIHLGDELPELQRALRERVSLANRTIHAAGLPLLADNDIPIRFIPMGVPRVAAEIAQRMTVRGYYVNVSMFPTVPLRRAGIRVSINANHTTEQIEGMIGSLAEVANDVFREEGVDRREIDELFSRTAVGNRGAAPLYLVQSPRPSAARPELEALEVETFRSIETVDRALWDSVLGSAGTSSWASLRTVEQLYGAGQERPEHAWRFDYVFVRTQAGDLVAATYFVTSLQKDDFLMRAEISRAVEDKRAKNPYFLTSRVVMSGSTFSEGNPIYLDRSGPWRAALERLLGLANDILREENASAVVLRDLPRDDEELSEVLADLGYVQAPALDSHHLTIDFADETELAHRLSKRKRKYLLEQIERRSLFSVSHYGNRGVAGTQLSPEVRRHLYGLYRNVARKNLKINVFDLHPSFIDAILESQSWEVVTLSLAEAPERGPVAWYAAHVHGGHYAAFLCGLDYAFVLSHGAYRQTLLEMVRRARELGMTTVHLGMDADTEKARYGTTVVRNVMYAQAREAYQGAVLRELVASVGLQNNPYRP